MELVSQDKRPSKLLEQGIPLKFLESIGRVKELKFQVEPPEGAYHYFPSISNYEILKDCKVTPIFDQGESFWAVANTDDQARIIHFELEKDEVYQDFGLNWNLLLLEIMIDYYDFAIIDEITLEEFESVGNQIGFEQSRELFHLRNLSVEDYNSKFKDDKKWRAEIALELRII